MKFNYLERIVPLFEVVSLLSEGFVNSLNKNNPSLRYYSFKDMCSSDDFVGQSVYKILNDKPIRVARARYDFERNKIISQKNDLELQKDYEEYLKNFLDGTFED